jgi:ketosteroid isomerase-like protein
MEQESNVERVRPVLAQWAVGNFRAGAELFDPQVEFVVGPGFPDAGTYVGLAAVADYMRAFLEPWGLLTIAAEEFTQIGSNVVVAVVQRGVGSTSGAPTELRYHQVWTFAGDSVVRWENFRGRADALRAAAAGDAGG